jgi:hypothetical protein
MNSPNSSESDSLPPLNQERANGHLFPFYENPPALGEAFEILHLMGIYPGSSSKMLFWQNIFRLMM